LNSFAPFNKEKYAKASGKKDIDIEKIKESVSLIKNSNIDYEFRSTIVPSIHSKDDIIQMANDISPAKKYFLQRFRDDKGTINRELENSKPYSDEILKEIEENIKKNFQVFKIR
jgi:pyruvate formate lyase activating enzyme